MKKLVLLVIIGWMSVMTMTVKAQAVAFNGGYSFDLNHGAHPSRTDFAIDYFDRGLFGFGAKFPSAYDPRLELNVHGGVNFYWSDFWISPQVEIAYNHEILHEFAVGAGLQANYRIVGPLGVFTKIRWLSPIGFEPLSFGPGGATTLSVGLSMFWFR